MTESMKLISPVDGSVYAERPIATEAQVAAVFSAARDAQTTWAATPLHERIGYCLKALDAMLAMRTEIAEELTWQMGRPIRYTPYELNGVEVRTRHMAKIAAESLAPLDSGLENGTSGAHRYIKREPLGVVFVLAPWNYPYLTTVNSVMPALMAGNTVVLKHSDQTLLVAERFQKAFDAAGLPKGVFQHIVLSHDQSSRVIASGAVDMVAFTGSVGRQVEILLGERLPDAARHMDWWGELPARNSYASAWSEAGFQPYSVDLQRQSVVFGKSEHTRKLTPGSEVPGGDPTLFYTDECRHPLFGALRGMIEVEPGYDLTQPLIDEDWLKEKYGE